MCGVVSSTTTTRSAHQKLHMLLRCFIQQLSASHTTFQSMDFCSVTPRFHILSGFGKRFCQYSTARRLRKPSISRRRHYQMKRLHKRSCLLSQHFATTSLLQYQLFTGGRSRQRSSLWCWPRGDSRFNTRNSSGDWSVDFLHPSRECLPPHHNPIQVHFAQLYCSSWPLRVVQLCCWGTVRNAKAVRLMAHAKRHWPATKVTPQWQRSRRSKVGLANSWLIPYHDPWIALLLIACSQRMFYCIEIPGAGLWGRATRPSLSPQSWIL